MNIEPVFADFEPRYESGAAQVVWTRLVADLETPVSAMLKLSAGRNKCFLLESVEGGAVRGRYSIIGLSPDLVFRANGNVAEINDNALGDPDGFTTMAEPTLEALRADQLPIAFAHRPLIRPTSVQHLMRAGGLKRTDQRHHAATVQSRVGKRRAAEFQ